MKRQDGCHAAGSTRVSRQRLVAAWPGRPPCVSAYSQDGGRHGETTKRGVSTMSEFATGLGACGDASRCPGHAACSCAGCAPARGGCVVARHAPRRPHGHASRARRPLRPGSSRAGRTPARRPLRSGGEVSGSGLASDVAGGSGREQHDGAAVSGRPRDAGRPDAQDAEHGLALPGADESPRIGDPSPSPPHTGAARTAAPPAPLEVSRSGNSERRMGRHATIRRAAFGTLTRTSPYTGC